ncbi:MAG: exosortase A [Massilia sp.]
MNTTITSSRDGAPRALLLALALLLPLAIYFSTAQSIVAIWNRSETFAHGYIILPISLWLIWKQRASLARTAVKPFWPAYILLLGCGFGWVLAKLGDVQIVMQYMLACMLPLSVLAIAGFAITRQILFALLFILFAVPFGEVFIPPLIGVTANFTVDALRLTGIPVLREGNSFTIPSGSWSVVEACSGVRYLISSFTLGCLYAYLTYRSRWRQALFVLMSILVPILANGARAYMIVMMGHLSGMTMAVGVDHLIYGWVFFGIVMFLLFWIGSFWREDQKDGGAADVAFAQRLRNQPPSSRAATLAGAALALALVIGVWPLYAWSLQRAEHNPVAARLAPLATDWSGAPAFTDWQPGFDPAPTQSRQFYAKDGRQVGASVLYYRNQQLGQRLISSTNQMVQAKSDWRDIDSALRTEQIGGHAFTVREDSLKGPSGRLLVWRWYWIDQQTTTSDYVGKALQVRQKMLHGSDDGAAVMLYAAYDEHPESARAALRAFLTANQAALDAGLAANIKR